MRPPKPAPVDRDELDVDDDKLFWRVSGDDRAVRVVAARAPPRLRL